MAAKDRIQAIRQMATNGKKVIVSNLGGIFQITEETIYRNLEKLEDEGFSARTYGGAVLNTAMLTENIHFYERASSFCEGKQLITRKALPFIDDKTTMAANPSSTVMELFRSLQDRSDLTSLTNSAKVIHALVQSETKVISTGGELDKNTLSLRGRITKEIVSRYHVNTMTISCKGPDINSDALDSNEAGAEIKKTMIRQTTEAALLVDHSKFDRKASVQLADFNHINYIMTDKSSGAKWIAFYRDNGTQPVW